MKADGSVIIDTKIVDGGMEKGFNQLKSRMNSVGVAAEKMGDKIKLSFSGDVSAPIQNAAAKVIELERKIETATEGFYNSVYANDDKGAERWAAKRESAYARLEAAQKRLTQVIAAESAKQERAQDKALKKATKGAKTFSKRLTSVISGALVFSLISKGLREITEYFGKALRTNKQFVNTSNKLKGALLTAFQPLYETLLPAIITGMEVLTKYALMLGRFFSSITGKNAEQMKENASALYDQAAATEEAGNAAKKASHQIGGFDELNVMQKEEGGSADFNLESVDMNNKLSEMVALTSAALLALGLILAFSGINIPLGIGLIALGAAGLYQTVAENWGAIVSYLQTPIGVLIGLLSGAVLVVLGILVCIAGGWPLGIGLIAAGAAFIGTTVAVNWNAIIEALQGPIGELVFMVGGLLLIIGIIICFSGVGLPLGIGLIAAGAAGMATVVALNWNAVKETLVSVFASIMAIISGAAVVIGVLMCLSGAGIPLGLSLIFKGMKGTAKAWNLSDNPITRFVKNLANTVIGIINQIAEAINDLFNIEFKGLTVGGIQVIPAFNAQLMKLPKIPMLAQGAVLPPNKPFLSVVGDQRNGTNIEAPLSTIEEAVARVTGEQSERMVSALYTLIEIVEQKDLNVQIGDDDIGRANARYKQTRGAQVNTGVFSNAY